MITTTTAITPIFATAKMLNRIPRKMIPSRNSLVTQNFIPGSKDDGKWTVFLTTIPKIITSKKADTGDFFRLNWDLKKSPSIP